MNHRRRTSPTWLKETPVPSPTTTLNIPPITTKPDENPYTVHHYYKPQDEHHVSSQSKHISVFKFSLFILIGILIMYLVHCLYTVPDLTLWKEYTHFRGYVSSV